MSVSVQQILGFLRAVAPQELALDWDNVGLLVDAGQPVDGVLTTLDITPAVVREAVENDCQLIVSHHPVIFHPLRTLAADDVPALLMKNGISAICMHTNLDAAPGGVNDTLCDILGIAAEGRESFAEGCGRIGTTMPTTVEALAKFCAATLHSGVKYVNGQKPVTCLAEVSGGGGSYLEEAIARGADAEAYLGSYDSERQDAIRHNVDVFTDRLTRFGINASPSRVSETPLRSRRTSRRPISRSRLSTRCVSPDCV